MSTKARRKSLRGVVKIAKLLALAALLLTTSAGAFWLYKNESQLHITAPLDLSRAGSSVSLQFRPTYGQQGKIARLKVLYGLYEEHGKMGKDYKTINIYDENLTKKLFFKKYYEIDLKVLIFEINNNKKQLIAEKQVKTSAYSMIDGHRSVKLGSKKLRMLEQNTEFSMQLEPKNYEIQIINMRDDFELNGDYTAITINTHKRVY